MSRLQCRGSIAGVALVVALLSSRPAAAQVGVNPGPPRESQGVVRGLVTGVTYDVVNMELAEKKLLRLEAKYRRDAERGHEGALKHDVRHIENTRYRIAIEDWVIHWNRLQYPPFYAIRNDSVSTAAIIQAACPTFVPNPQQRVPGTLPTPGAPTLSVTILNAETAGTGVVFAIDGVVYHAPIHSRQDLVASPDSILTYDSGGSLGLRRYRISPGIYEFRPTTAGWALYKVAGIP